MEIRTHKKASSSFVGQPISVTEGEAAVELKATEDMCVDDVGLIHGGFTFSVADYAAMLAVDDPNVVLASAKVRFMAPVRLGDTMRGFAKVMGSEGNRIQVAVEVSVKDTTVLEGDMICYVLDKHVLL